jgi:hypothetical protein
MKKLVLFVCICVLVACRGENKSSSITDTTTTALTDSKPSVSETVTPTNFKIAGLTDFKWVLSSAIVTPAMTMNGKTSTNYMDLEGKGSCLGGGYALTFLETGIYQSSSNGASCKMPPNNDDQKWSLEGDTIILKNKYGSSNPYIFKGNTIVQNVSIVNNGVTYKIDYTYKSVKLK